MACRLVAVWDDLAHDNVGFYSVVIRIPIVVVVVVTLRTVVGVSTVHDGPVSGDERGQIRGKKEKVRRGRWRMGRLGCRQDVV